MTTHAQNPLGLSGISFVEFASAEPQRLHELFSGFGFSRTRRHRKHQVDLYEQGKIRFLLSREVGSFAASFERAHGPCISAMGLFVESPEAARDEAVRRGARRPSQVDYQVGGRPVPAIYGIGDSIIYFVDEASGDGMETMGFLPLDAPDRVPDKGFLAIDHLTNNVQSGTMGRWASFYKDVFGFTEVRYFDIRGVKTGLTSYALRSPCGTFCIPINEADEKKSQINEYLDQYRGPGIQHIAFLTGDLLASLRKLEGAPITFLDMDSDYYATVFERVPRVSEDHEEIQRRNVLVDGDEEGYLLQIFTKNLVGPIFIELIQRKNHLSFGEGNFGALFRSIERDQARRGIFDDEL